MKRMRHFLFIMSLIAFRVSDIFPAEKSFIGLDRNETNIEPTHLGVLLTDDIGISIGHDSANFFVFIQAKKENKNKKTTFVIADEIILPYNKVGSFSLMSANSGGCGYRDKIDPNILGYFISARLDSHKKYYIEIQRAWRIDRVARRFIEISTKYLTCKKV